MVYGECYLFTGIITAGKGALAVFNSESDVAAHELDAAIAHQRAGKQARFSQYLKAVADADDGDAALCRFHHGPHDRRTCGHCAGAQIIAIGEAAGHADHVNAVGQIGIAMPDHVSLTARNFTERSEEHTYELQSLMRTSYADLYVKEKKYI